MEDLVWSEAKRVLQNPALIVAGIEALEDREGGGAANSVEVDLPPDLPPVAADRQRVVQVLTNLFSNASKYSPASSTIMVTASQQDSHVAVSVADEGRGVSSEELPQLFRKFLRINGADGKTEVGGEGLDLAICKGIVEAHGGRIWAESDGLGLGTRSPCIPAKSVSYRNGPAPLLPSRRATPSG